MEHIKKLLEQKATTLSKDRVVIDELELKKIIKTITKDIDFSIRVTGKKLTLITSDHMAAAQLYQSKDVILTELKKLKQYDFSHISIQTNLTPNDY